MRDSGASTGLIMAHLGERSEAMAKLMVILNPAAGHGRAANLASKIHARLKARTAFEWVETQRPDHAVELAERAARDGFDVIAAAGGDGTAHEVANGILRAGSGAALGLIPVGSGNDFAWMAGAVLDDPERAARQVVEGVVRQVDAGQVRDERGPTAQRYFTNGIGIGFDAVVAIESRKLRRLRGFTMYVVAVLQTMRFYYRATNAALDNDGRRIELPLLMGSIAIGRRYGGGFLVCPSASPDDGLFDVCLVPQVSRLSMLAFIPRFMKGTHVTDRRVTMARGAHVTVRCAEPMAVHADGEIFSNGSREIEAQILPGALRVVV
jgi:YegS/Rv2252/BmrU family lipid kinase